ncbi:Transcriptional regulator, TetR family [Caballeronia glathei]|jgi:TetR/AcrR family transcriptional repressor of nem operon|uniref:Transcriptional regulator n=1 Tax=Caballeronia glathei TaxID=60547 RepID=A0A069PBG3_9BURK|nr:TetR/AcrR family transcriptional regulator [Caballeronia glathei]KDR37832.1 transcriptional regulator [Caballeronia glathei]CDY76168.1 Transcriptional regulator, TetR family [Caballeronia glathei]
MKVTKEKAAENRSNLIRTASRLFREHGIDGVGVAEICKQAGLTHGALYAQFPTKQALAAEALAYGQELGFEHLMSLGDGGGPALDDFLDYYLSTSTRDDPAHMCAMAASASEIGRQDSSISAPFAQGFEKIAEAIERTQGPGTIEASTRERALSITAALIGAVAVARGVHKADPALSKEVLQAMKTVLAALGANGDDAVKRKKRRKPASGTA